MTSTRSFGRKILAMVTPQATWSLDIVLDSNPVVLLGATTSVAPALLHGRVTLKVFEPMKILEITLRFKGRACVPSTSESLGDAECVFI